jgi:hypothetical protein
MEKHFAFVKNGRVIQVAVFGSQDQELADRIASEQGFDSAIWVGENKPVMFSEYDGKKFIAPTNEYLISIGIIDPIIEETPTA